VSLSEKIDGTSASGRMSLTMMIAFNQLERDLVSERTKAALQYLRNQGKISGTIPFGSKLDSDGKSLVPDAAELAARNVPTKTGGKWSSGSIFRILQNRPLKLAAL